MMAKAFCPAHMTGFFTIRREERIENTGSLGAGFSIRLGIETSVEIDQSRANGCSILFTGYTSSDSQVSERIVDEYSKRYRLGFVKIQHKITAPVGYGFGCSAAAALSLSMALNAALGSPLTKQEEAGIAHKIEIECKTGLGDVLAAYHGGFEMRYHAGAPGVGMIKKINYDSKIVIACFAPISTKKFMTKKIDNVNGLGGEMLSKLVKSKNIISDFQDMSLEFAQYIGVMTPRTRTAVNALHKVGIKCGVALFGETVFAMVDHATEMLAVDVLESLDGCTVLRSQIDKKGARLQTLAPVIAGV